MARPTLSWDGNKPGADCLKYKPELVLTKEGLSCSRWQLPDFLKEANISYHSGNSWKDGYFQSVAKGQEFVIETEQKYLLQNWANDLIKEE